MPLHLQNYDVLKCLLIYFKLMSVQNQEISYSECKYTKMGRGGDANCYICQEKVFSPNHTEHNGIVNREVNDPSFTER